MKKAIAWYRPNPIPRLLVIGFISGTLMIIGVIIMAFGMDQSGRVEAQWRNPSIVIGVSIVISGVLNACLRVYKTLEHDKTTLMLCHSGIEYQNDTQAEFLSWSDLKGVSYSEGLLTLKTFDGQILIRDRFLGISGTELAQKIKEVQHHILLGVPIRD